MPATAYINRIATEVPPHDVHDAFVHFARTMLECGRKRALFTRMASHAGIDHRFSYLNPGGDAPGPSVNAHAYYKRGQYPSTAQRMATFEEQAPELARRAVTRLALGAEVKRITHVIVTCCTGLYAPGLDLQLVEHLGLDPSVERTMVAFMGCYAAINALKLARHIVRSEPEARVLLLNLELCTLHLQETQDLEQILSFLIFGDGCAASLISADPVGLGLDSFRAVLVSDTRELITWRVGELGFDMFLSGRVPGAIGRALQARGREIIADARPEHFELWAVHPGGRSVLDAVERGLGLPASALAASRDILSRFGNMSSATVMFVLESILRTARLGERGCAMSFGPGLTAETFLFHAA